jgi:hypothetical protein
VATAVVEVLAGVPVWVPPVWVDSPALVQAQVHQADSLPLELLDN